MSDFDGGFDVEPAGSTPGDGDFQSDDAAAPPPMDQEPPAEGYAPRDDGLSADDLALPAVLATVAAASAAEDAAPDSERIPADSDPGVPDSAPATPAAAPDNPDAEQPEAVAEPVTEPFEELSVAAALSLLLRHPRQTAPAFWTVLREPKDADLPEMTVISQERAPEIAVDLVVRAPSDQSDEGLSRGQELLVLGLRAIAFVIAWLGSYLMVNGPNRSEADGLAVGILPLLLGLVVWIAAEVVALALPRTGGRPKLFRAEAAVPGASAGMSRSGLITRGVLFVLAVVIAGLSIQGSSINRFTIPGVALWMLSLGLMIGALLPAAPSIGGWLRGVGRALRPRLSWTFFIILGLIIIGAYVRLHDLAQAPGELTSDHVEMLLDALRVQNGASDIFFANNGGREALQFYLLAVFARLPGAGINFDTLKLLTVLEGVLTIPVMYFMAREVIGRERRQLAVMTGLAAAVLVSVSLWHVTISRLGERIALMPLFTALFILFFARALRYGRRSDFIYAGLTVGVGLYTYQAFRLIPLVLIVGGLIALLFTVRDWRALGKLALNLIALALVAFVLYLPLFAYSVAYPEDYWRRTSGRLFGDDITQEANSDGVLVYRAATLDERIQAFSQNAPILASNIRNALLMYNWKGDVAWFNNAPNEPAFDPIAGGLLVAGVGAWIGLMLRRRDPFIWLLPAMLLIMILPSALSIAFPIENPSATRMSGTLPLVYLLAGLALALLLCGIMRVVRGAAGGVIAFLAGGALILGSAANNNYRYFNLYAPNYTIGSLPYSAAGEVMRSFAEEVGGWGNVFVINYPYWWDHRALGIEAGQPGFPNGIPALDQVPEWLRAASYAQPPYVIDVNRDLLFFYSAQDQLTQDWLQMTFPNGSWVEMTTYQPEDVYRIFRVPALGQAGYDELIARISSGTQG